MTRLFEDAAALLGHLRAHGCASAHGELESRIDHVLGQFRQRSHDAGYPDDAIEHAVYAFVASVDEAILSTASPVRDAWEANPLQLSRYGDQLAGEKFFDRLAAVRERGVPYTEVTEVFHLCMALGFQGKYALRSDESLRHLTQTLNIDIGRARPKAARLGARSARSAPAFLRRRRGASTWIASSLIICGVLVGGASARLSYARQPPATSAENLTVAPAAVKAWLKITLP